MTESVKISMPLNEAQLIAELFVNSIRGACQRVAIAGSIRRRKPIVGDIEVVCVPRVSVSTDLFGAVVHQPGILLDLALAQADYVFVQNGPRKKTFLLPAGIAVDLHIVEPEQWGMALLIRTGSADFSKWFVTQRNKGGGLPSYLHVKDLRIWNRGQALDTTDEIDCFTAAQQPWIVPELRSVGLWRRG
jgi:DNA polymerase/3'-5' exonuclease PolX